MRVPPNFREIMVEPFDGSQDPHAHLQAFQTQMYISGGDDKLSYKLFPGTLRGVAMQWMATLPARTIRTFNDLANAFTSQFAANKTKQMEVADLQALHPVEREESPNTEGNMPHEVITLPPSLRWKNTRQQPHRMVRFSSYYGTFHRSLLDPKNPDRTTHPGRKTEPILGRTIATIWADITTARKCYEDSLKIELTTKEAEVNVLDIDLDPRHFSEEKRPHLVGDLKEVQIRLSASQKTSIGTTLDEKEEGQLISTL
ncbi:hypothetical protein CR513_21272, partial [Mucuna pruriens]